MSLDLRSLIGRLNQTTRGALEAAGWLCKSRTQYEVELEHWLAALLDAPGGDLPRILRHFSVSPERFARDLERAIDRFKTGNSRQPALSPTIELLAREGWVQSSINFQQTRVRSGVILLAALSDARLRRQLVDVHPELRNVNVEELQLKLLELVKGSSEDAESVTDPGATEREVAAPGPAGTATKTPALDKFTVDLTAAAREGRIDPVLGRDFEIRQIVDILTRRRQNNPILTGEAGVGKTAVVEGFALRIAAQDVPEALANVTLRSLDMGLLQAGAGVKGEFENRLKQVIEEVRSSATPIILFIDEAHTMIGAGGAEGQSDAANLLKPALARGELRTIAATTWAEYKKYFEKDAALSRRFQVIKVDEPGIDAAISMMRGVASMLETHHGVRILDEAISESVRLSSRYIPARQLPDKCMSVLDTACARVAMAQQAVPAPIEDLRRRIDALDREEGILVRESAVGIEDAERLVALRGEREQARGALAALEKRWQEEKELVTRLRDLRGELEAADSMQPPLTAERRAELRAAYDAARVSLTALQAEEPLVAIDVDAQAVAEVISGWTGIPIGKMVADEIRTVLRLGAILGERVIGQQHALDAVARRIQTSRAQLDNPQRPIGVFLLAGPSGVGKTETAMALADTLYGGERNSVIINMSEYQEAHTVSSLKGSPPGYVGYGEGGVLTEAVRRRPYSVVLLDEVEKAHPDVMELFFQVFDKGVLEDGEGREIDFKNTVILLTSNVGSELIMSLCKDPETNPESDALADAIRPELLKHFPAALLGRLVVIPYYPISPDMMRQIIRLQLGRIQKRFRENHGAELVCSDAIVDAVLARCREAESGARAVDRILTHSLLPQMSNEVLSRMAAGQAFSKIEVGIEPGGEFRFTVS
jgi:type VI secretion system protein VasG